MARGSGHSHEFTNLRPETGATLIELAISGRWASFEASKARATVARELGFDEIVNLGRRLTEVGCRPEALELIGDALLADLRGELSLNAHYRPGSVMRKILFSYAGINVDTPSIYGRDAYALVLPDVDVSVATLPAVLGLQLESLNENRVAQPHAESVMEGAERTAATASLLVDLERRAADLRLDELEWAVTHVSFDPKADDRSFIWRRWVQAAESATVQNFDDIAPFSEDIRRNLLVGLYGVSGGLGSDEEIVAVLADALRAATSNAPASG